MLIGLSPTLATEHLLSLSIYIIQHKGNISANTGIVRSVWEILKIFFERWTNKYFLWCENNFCIKVRTLKQASPRNSVEIVVVSLVPDHSLKSSVLVAMVTYMIKVPLGALTGWRKSKWRTRLLKSIRQTDHFSASSQTSPHQIYDRHPLQSF